MHATWPVVVRSRRVQGNAWRVLLDSEHPVDERIALLQLRLVVNAGPRQRT
jgi:hypothetical protein